jgi:hypothetical protein
MRNRGNRDYEEDKSNVKYVSQDSDNDFCPDSYSKFRKRPTGSGGFG